MKLDLHVHTAFSICASADYKAVTAAYGEIGTSFVLCNHYNALYTKPMGGMYSREEYPRLFVEEFFRTREEGARRGIKVFFGIEVAICLPDCPYAEYLIYGASPKFLTDNPYVYDLDQRGLYELCKSNGLFLVQAHPFRKEQGHFPHDCKLIDGVEINCHHRFLREEEKVRRLAETYGLKVTCGSDFHGVGQGAGGIICDDISSEAELGAVLSSGKYEIFMR